MKTACEQNTELLTVAERYQLLVFYADALYEEQEYKRAEVRSLNLYCLHPMYKSVPRIDNIPRELEKQ